MLFLPFALSPRLLHKHRALPLDVLARQSAQLMTSLVHRQEGIQARFFPFVSNDGARRGFASFEDLLEPEVLVAKVLAPILPRPERVVDGRLGLSGVQLRLIDTTGEGTALREVAWPCDPTDPRVFLNRLVLELWDLLDLPTRPVAPPTLSAPACWAWLRAMDADLALAANLGREDVPDPFAAWAEALALAPEAPAVHEGLLGTAAQCIDHGRGDSTEAAEALAHAATRSVVTARYLERAFVLAQRSGNRPAAERIGLRLLGLEPGRKELAFGLARWFAGNRRFTEARSVLEACVRTWGEDDLPRPEGPEILALLYQLGLSLGDDEAATRWIERLRRVDDLPRPVVGTVVRWLLDKDRLDEAEALLAATLRGDEDVGDDVEQQLVLERGRLAMLRNRPGEARRWLEDARAHDGPVGEEASRLLDFVGRPEVLTLLETTENLHRDGEQKAALKLAKQAVKQNPDLPQAWYALGLVRSSLGQTRRAIRALHRALVLEEDFPEARNRLGILLVASGDYERGYRELARVLSEQGDLMSPLLHMSQACYYLRRFEEGLSYVERAEALFPEHPAVRQTRTTFYPVD
ncbi:MAG: tetratricopeptide repeat protein [Planctomycetota bacterium]